MVDLALAPPPPVFVPPGTPRSAPARSYVGSMGWFGLLFGGIWAIVGWAITLGFLFFGRPFWEDWILDGRGVPASGTPLGVEDTSSTVNGRRVREITLRFRDGDGIERTARSGTTDGGLVERARKGQSLALHYDPARPERARIDGTRLSVFGLWVLFPFVFAAVGTVIIAFSLRGILRRRRLYVWGESALGKVVSVTSTNTSINNRQLLEIRYRFLSTAGEIEGKFRHVEAPPVGSDVSVLYDARAPGRNLLPTPGAFGV